MDNIINIFTAPTKAFENLNTKPTWLIPFLITVVFVVGYQYFTIDITMDYEIAKLETRDMPEAQFEAAKSQMSGGMRYIGMIAGPIFVPIIWAILAGLLLAFSKITVPSGIDFKKAFSIIAWSGLVSLTGMLLLGFLIVSKGSMHGVALDLSAVLATPAIGETTSVLHRIFTRIDPFVIWQLVLWAIGLSVMGKVDIKKAAIPVAILWGLWIIISVSLGGFFQSLGM